MQSETLIGKTYKQHSFHSEYIPPLENGDRLNREEFYRRYEEMPNVKAERIKGVVYMSSPVRIDHAEQTSAVNLWLGTYSVLTKGTKVAENATVKLDGDSDPQPDVLLRVDENFGGNAFITSDRYLEGAPELVVEVALSTVSFDLHDKKDTYQNNGVKEYIVWRVLDNEIDWFVLDNGKYAKLFPDENGIIESRFFGGLRLKVEAMLKGDLAQVLSDLQEGINSDAHSQFVGKMKSRLS